MTILIDRQLLIEHLYDDAKEKVKKTRELISTGRYDKILPNTTNPSFLELKFQGMLEDIDTR